MNPMVSERIGPTLPWWRVRMVWLVLGGPAIVVVAGFVTLGIAIRGGDRPLLEGGAATAATAAPAAPAALAESHAPATQGRNHVLAPRR